MSGDINNLMIATNTPESSPMKRLLSRSNLFPVKEPGSLPVCQSKDLGQEMTYGVIDEQQKKVHLENMMSSRGIPLVQVCHFSNEIEISMHQNIPAPTICKFPFETHPGFGFHEFNYTLPQALTLYNKIFTP